MTQAVCATPGGVPTSADGFSQVAGGPWHGGTGQGTVTSCNARGGWIGMTLGNGGFPITDGYHLTWTYTAPANTRISGYALTEYWYVDWPLVGANNAGNVYMFHSWHDAWSLNNFFETPLPPFGGHSGGNWHPLAGDGVDYGSLSFQLDCAEINNPPGGDCNPNSFSEWRLSAGTIKLRDNSAPQVSQVSGSITRAGTKRGTAALAFNASDVGVGVYRAISTIDGRQVASTILDDNGGHCAPRGAGYLFGWAVPCKLALSASLNFDTSTLVNGPHDVHVTLEDAAGNTAIVWDDQITTDNAPQSTARPGISGTPHVGLPLAASLGSWSPAPSAYGLQWLRCPAQVTSPSGSDGCTEIPGAIGPLYVPGDDDAYHRLMIRVTAANASGSAVAVSAPTEIVADMQGHTTAPGPSGGLVVVPGGGSFSITTNISSPGDSSQLISGLVNPLASLTGHVANGTNANEYAQLSIAFQTRVRGLLRQATTVRSTRNRRWTIRGRLTDSTGAPIGGGRLVSAWQMPSRGWVAHPGLRTRSDGRFTYVLPAGPSRQIRFVYFAFSDSTSYSQSNAITEKVTTPVRLRVSPRALRNGRSVRFTGTVGVDAMPKLGVLVTLEARAPGTRWTKFNVIRTHGSRFSTRYRFHSTTRRTRYLFRATVAKQTGYPYEGGRSKRVTVTVTP